MSIKEIKITVFECVVEHGLVVVNGHIYGCKQLDEYHGQALDVKPFARNKVAIFDGGELVCVAEKVWWDCMPSLNVDELVESWCAPKAVAFA